MPYYKGVFFPEIVEHAPETLQSESLSTKEPDPVPFEETAPVLGEDRVDASVIPSDPANMEAAPVEEASAPVEASPVEESAPVDPSTVEAAPVAEAKAEKGQSKPPKKK